GSACSTPEHTGRDGRPRGSWVRKRPRRHVLTQPRPCHPGPLRTRGRARQPRSPPAVEAGLELAYLLGQGIHRTVHGDVGHDLADRQCSYRSRGHTPLLQPRTQLGRGTGVHDPSQTHPTVRGRTHGAVLTRGVDGRLGAFGGTHVGRRPPDDRKLRMLGTVTPGDVVVILEEHLTVRADQHRTERLVPRPQGLGGQIHRTPQVPQVVIVHHVASVRSCSVPTPTPKSSDRFDGALFGCLGRVLGGSRTKASGPPIFQDPYH